ncbi:glycosyltransferase family 2 protein [Mucilaginibacter myungsuensis]|uniref:Glycosyltransferase family 2 protein n=1 Tax=Mucilaginibacter myungsuensis TaxID=649104 RepID=A0A929PVB3_9SPHI|nr:glycosyltransferase family 2 protein [Mucilaginibacter myungsuensis]MBE9660831.1 glycosyltransferase family 2 protein [Mucilaginibacter myungsuensis]MDN3600878.1 glycosyltransferase [Mucilaginibacter myungsuensis]
MPITEPLVSIIIPAHNAAKHVRETVQCALDQTWPNKEVIVVNNGSTDATLEILQNIPGIKLIDSKVTSASAARNVGLAAAEGNYIQFLDADDLLSPDKITSQIACLDGTNEVLSFCPAVLFNDGEDPLSIAPDSHWFSAKQYEPADLLKKLYAGEDQLPGYGGFITVHSWLTPRAVIDKAGPWNEDLTTDDDGEFFCRVALASKGIKFCDKGVNYYRKHQNAGSLSTQKTLKSFESTVLATDLKYKWLKAANADPIIDKIFARFYWWTGIMAYPRFKNLSTKCITTAKGLGYEGDKYVGGKSGHLISKFLGWRMARLFSYYKHS